MKYFASGDSSPWNCKVPLCQCMIYLTRVLSWEQCNGWELRNFCFNANVTSDFSVTLGKLVTLIGFYVLQNEDKTILPQSLGSRLNKELKPNVQAAKARLVLQHGGPSPGGALPQIRSVQSLSPCSPLGGWPHTEIPYVWGICMVFKGILCNYSSHLIFSIMGVAEFIITSVL